MNWGSVAAIAFAGAVSISSSALSAEKAELGSVEELRWKYRVILLSSSRGCDKEIAVLREANTEVLDRDILWFAFCADELTTNFSGPVNEAFAQATRDRYFSSDVSGTPETVLIGKDGGVKDRSTSLDLSALNAQIDGMPMRQREMREADQ